MRMRYILAFSAATGVALAAINAAAQSADSAPPARVGQIALLRGGVSFNAQGSDSQAADGQAAENQGSGGWAAAQLNYPVTTGDALYTQPDAEAAIAVDWSRITLSGGTEFAITVLDDRTLQATEAQGEIYLDLRYLPQGDQFNITTPRGTVTIARGGRYDIIAGDQNTPTQVTVLAGSASVNGQNVAISVGQGETAALNGDNPVTASLGGARSDRFMASLARAAVQPPPSYVPQSVGQMTGGDELSQYGAWSRTSQYGAVWYPRVAPGWVPYRSGHWAYVQPWGWTWVASEPWGFAPFHYGRWVDIDDRWGWAPSPVQSEGYSYAPSYSWPAFDQPYQQPDYYQEPVYAPALVSFFGIGAGVAIAAGSVGWVPLGPDEPYYPHYRCPPRYIRQINVSNVRNVTNITRISNNTTIINKYGPERLANRRAATVLPAAAMRQGDPVAHFGRPVPATILAAAHPIPPAGYPIAGHPLPGHPLPGHPVPGHPIAGHPGPSHAEAALTRLPAPPLPLAHRLPGAAPRPAAFAVARGIPVAHPGPIRPAAARVLGVPNPREINQPRRPAPNPAPVDHAPVDHAPVNRALINHPPAAPPRPVIQPPAHFAAPGFQNQLRQVPPPPQMPHAPGAPQHVQPVARPPAPAYHPPAYHPPAYHPPVYHPPVYHPPVYHPPVQPARPVIHPPAQPVFHPPGQPVFRPPAQPAFRPPAQPAFRPPAQPAFRPPAQPAFRPPAFHPAAPQPQPAPRVEARPGPDRQPNQRP